MFKMPPKRSTGNNKLIAAAKQTADAARAAEEEYQARLKAAREEEERIKEEERLEAERIEKERLEKKAIKDAKIAKKKESGTFKTESQKKQERDRLMSLQRGFVSSNSKATTELVYEINEEKQEADIFYRSPIVCILGHVDTGKTTILDKIRSTSVQKKEAAGITQQIGASFVPRRLIGSNLNTPGLLFIDTPGHTAFSNLRIRGSEICDVAVIIIDVMKGIENQTKESIQLCKNKGIRFILALNKIDRIYGYSDAQGTIKEKLQSLQAYERLHENIMKEFWDMEYQPLHFEDYYDNEDENKLMYIPVSGFNGDGISDLLYQLSMYSQVVIPEEISIVDLFKGFVMESKKQSNGESSIDVIVVNGTISVGDIIGISTISGPITTKVRSLLLPAENEEMRQTNKYVSVSEVTGSCGVKILGENIENVIPGTEIYILEHEEQKFRHFEIDFGITQDGVAVSARSIGQVQGLIKHLTEENNIQVSLVIIGDVRKKNILIMQKYQERFKHILCFETDINADALDFCDTNKITIHRNETVYRLSEDFLNRTREFEENRIKELRRSAKLPFKLRIVESIRNNPLVLAVSVEGELSVNSLVIDNNDRLLGTITSIRHNDQPVEIATTGQEVSILLETELKYGRHIKKEHTIYPVITRESLDILKEHFREELNNEASLRLIKEIKLIRKIK